MRPTLNRSNLTALVEVGSLLCLFPLVTVSSLGCALSNYRWGAGGGVEADFLQGSPRETTRPLEHTP